MASPVTFSSQTCLFIPVTSVHGLWCTGWQQRCCTFTEVWLPVQSAIVMTACCLSPSQLICMHESVNPVCSACKTFKKPCKHVLRLYKQALLALLPCGIAQQQYLPLQVVEAQLTDGTTSPVSAYSKHCSHVADVHQSSCYSQSMCLTSSPALPCQKPIANMNLCC